MLRAQHDGRLFRRAYRRQRASALAARRARLLAVGAACALGVLFLVLLCVSPCAHLRRAASR